MANYTLFNDEDQSSLRNFGNWLSGELNTLPPQTPAHVDPGPRLVLLPEVRPDPAAYAPREPQSFGEALLNFGQALGTTAAKGLMGFAEGYHGRPIWSGGRRGPLTLEEKLAQDAALQEQRQRIAVPYEQSRHERDRAEQLRDQGYRQRMAEERIRDQHHYTTQEREAGQTFAEQQQTRSIDAAAGRQKAGQTFTKDWAHSLENPAYLRQLADQKDWEREEGYRATLEQRPPHAYPGAPATAGASKTTDGLAPWDATVDARKMASDYGIPEETVAQIVGRTLSSLQQPDPNTPVQTAPRGTVYEGTSAPSSLPLQRPAPDNMKYVLTSKGYALRETPESQQALALARQRGETQGREEALGREIQKSRDEINLRLNELGKYSALVNTAHEGDLLGQGWTAVGNSLRAQLGYTHETQYQRVASSLYPSLKKFFSDTGNLNQSEQEALLAMLPTKMSTAESARAGIGYIADVVNATPEQRKQAVTGLYKFLGRVPPWLQADVSAMRGMTLEQKHAYLARRRSRPESAIGWLP